jgi:hypothetical protein
MNCEHLDCPLSLLCFLDMLAREPSYVGSVITEPFMVIHCCKCGKTELQCWNTHIQDWRENVVSITEISELPCRTTPLGTTYCGACRIPHFEKLIAE